MSRLIIRNITDLIACFDGSTTAAARVVKLSPQALDRARSVSNRLNARNYWWQRRRIEHYGLAVELSLWSFAKEPSFKELKMPSRTKAARTRAGGRPVSRATGERLRSAHGQPPAT